jgi:hypothetical protein
MTAPAQGLFLVGVHYEDSDERGARNLERVAEEEADEMGMLE